LKPDVCRRMVGRLPSPPLEMGGMAAAWINTKQLSCEIRSDSNPSHSSHDWHVQPSLSKTELHSRLSGRPSVEDGSGLLTACEIDAATPHPLVLETCTPYRSRKQSVNPLCSQDFHLFSTDPPIPLAISPSAGKTHRGNLPGIERVNFERATELNLPFV